MSFAIEHRLTFQACPDFKGIKTPNRSSLCEFRGFKLALISKGLRPLQNRWPMAEKRFKLALISKGLRPSVLGASSFFSRFKLALISKGLRLTKSFVFKGNSSFKLALISKGLRLNQGARRGAIRVSSLP